MSTPHPPPTPSARIAELEALTEQLQQALDTRIDIEQAKGMLMERYQVDQDAAFDMLRKAARSGRHNIHALARQIIDAIPKDDPTGP